MELVQDEDANSGKTNSLKFGKCGAIPSRVIIPIV